MNYYNDEYPTENELLQYIIDAEGDCIKASWCLVCPFCDNCVFNALRGGKLMSREVRVKLASDRLFNKILECELNE